MLGFVSEDDNTAYPIFRLPFEDTMGHQFGGDDDISGFGGYIHHPGRQVIHGVHQSIIEQPIGSWESRLVGTGQNNQPAVARVHIIQIRKDNDVIPLPAP